MRMGWKAGGTFDHIMRFFNRTLSKEAFAVLDEAAQQGVVALEEATPKDSGVTSGSWGYEIITDGTGTSIFWTNTSVTYQGDPIVILLHYGHGTGTGGYVQGRDFINPAIRPIFDNISDVVWKVMTGL